MAWKHAGVGARRFFPASDRGGRDFAGNIVGNVELLARNVTKVIAYPTHVKNTSPTKPLMFRSLKGGNMKWVLSAGTIVCLALVGGAAGIARLHNQPDTALTETILANRDHLKVVRAISEMCSDMPTATAPDNLIAASSVRASFGGKEDIVYPVAPRKTTTFQMAAKNYSE